MGQGADANEGCVNYRYYQIGSRVPRLINNNNVVDLLIMLAIMPSLAQVSNSELYQLNSQKVLSVIEKRRRKGKGGEVPLINTINLSCKKTF